MFFIIRTFLILDKKNLQNNYIDLNIKKSLEANNLNGTNLTIINGNMDNIYMRFIEIISIICNIQNRILPELAYIIICIYINYNLKTVNRFINDIDLIASYNNIYIYKKEGKVTTNENITKIYNEIIKKLKI